MPALLRGERHGLEQAARLARVVVRNRGLEMLSGNKRLAQLATKPTQQADTGGIDHTHFYTRFAGPVAQPVEQGTFNPKVAGSNPARPILMVRSKCCKDQLFH